MTTWGAAAAQPAIAPEGTGDADAPELTHRPGRWIDGWQPENPAQWAAGGRAIARRNLAWSIVAEFLGFIVWQLWSIVVVQLPAAGFAFSAGEIFWLISMPSLVGATLRLPYTFLVPRLGGRNWTIISAGLLLIPTIALAVCVANPATPFGVMLLVAALSGFGGGNFASSMANITFFFPQKEKGFALGLNAAGGNVGASVAQFVVPVAVTVGAGAAVNLPLAGWIWVPLILVAMVGAWRFMDNLSHARADLAASLSAVREPHLWLLALLYIGTFGSFIGFAGVFPKLIVDQFPGFSSIPVGGAAISLAFVGALVGSAARPLGGRLADRFGGALVSVLALATMACGAGAVVLVLAGGGFWAFLGCFLLIFVATGIGNGSVYRMIPSVFAARAGVANARRDSGDLGTQRRTAAALGIISAVGAYGGFVIPQLMGLSLSTTGGYQAAIGAIGVAYLVLLGLTAAFYLRPGRANGGHRI
jgi:NNP family nitrate/nitrite transporter-like MFS transporter